MGDDEKLQALGLLDYWIGTLYDFKKITLSVSLPEEETRDHAREWDEATHELIALAERLNVDSLPLRRIRFRVRNDINIEDQVFRLTHPPMSFADHSPLVDYFDSGVLGPPSFLSSLDNYRAREDALLAVERIAEKLTKGMTLPESGSVPLTQYATHHSLNCHTLRCRITDHNKVHGAPDKIKKAETGHYQIEDLESWEMYRRTVAWRGRPLAVKWRGSCPSCKTQRRNEGLDEP